jgi:hypothetical protein
MVIEALKAARDFIESVRQDLAESLTVKGEIVFEDDIDRGAMAEYVKVLAVIDAALEQALAAQPVPAQPVAHIVGEIDHTGKVWKPVQPAPVPLTDEQIESLLPDDDTPMSLGEAFVKVARLVEAHHGITKGQP